MPTYDFEQNCSVPEIPFNKIRRVCMEPSEHESAIISPPKVQ